MAFSEVMLLQGYHCCEKVCGCEKNGPLFVKGKYWKGTSGPQRIAAYTTITAKPDFCELQSNSFCQAL